MPFASEKQRRWMWANMPETARRWTEKYGAKPVKPVKPAEERIALAMLQARARKRP